MGKLKTISKKIETFPQLVECYNEYYAPILERELELSNETIHSDQSDKDKARKILMGPHQRRLLWQHKEREEAIDALKENKIWEQSYKDFEELYDKVADTIGVLYRIGPLTVYDVAKRIGASMGIMPQKYVYIQSGAYEGKKNF